MKQPFVLSIAASDSSGGAGIQQDMRTAIDFNCWLLNAVTGVTVQDFKGLYRVEHVSTEIIRFQIERALSAFDVKAVKIGAVCDKEAIPVIANALRGVSQVILDPVFSPTKGEAFLGENLRELYEPLLEKARLITPNRNELETISGSPVATYDDAVEAAYALQKKFGCGILIKCGHFTEEPLRDILIDAGREYHFARKKKNWKYSHGTGCMLSTAIAACVAWGINMPEAVKKASDYLEKKYDVLNEMFA